MTAPFERAVMAEPRAEILGSISGVVLDVGAGTGANFPHLRRAARVIALEPDRRMRRQLEAKLASAPYPVQVLDARAEQLPLTDSMFDAVVFTCVLCTVERPEQALAEAWRVLKPGGTLAVLEHVRGTGALARWQDRITPLWARLMGGCHPNRDSLAAIRAAGFRIQNVQLSDPLPRWVPTRPLLHAIATR